MNNKQNVEADKSVAVHVIGKTRKAITVKIYPMLNDGLKKRALFYWVIFLPVSLRQERTLCRLLSLFRSQYFIMQ